MLNNSFFAFPDPPDTATGPYPRNPLSRRRRTAEDRQTDERFQNVHHHNTRHQRNSAINHLRALDEELQNDRNEVVHLRVPVQENGYSSSEEFVI